MLLQMLKSKIHRAIVTDANVDYEGSIAIDPAILKQANIAEFEQVHIYNITNGERLITYAIIGNKGDICINGAAARKVNIGDVIIIAAYALYDETEVNWFGSKPKIVYCDCEVDHFSSRVCEKGTKCCIKYHDKEEKKCL